MVSESALRSAGTLLSQVRALPLVPWPGGRPESLRSPHCGLVIYKNQPIPISFSRVLLQDSVSRMFTESWRFDFAAHGGVIIISPLFSVRPVQTLSLLFLHRLMLLMDV
ncbi:reverse transcriptase [Plakobranchus ocellatus]|uniref:Reverse transcriptase n=1 Tax=Plakobranchus ocellatus TaxID=259542 RepID=A0AAV4DQV6_9GAST|nr:reverse transcriptase [Plakobranchus ocellatus]